jgi:hypothetical protein
MRLLSVTLHDTGFQNGGIWDLEEAMLKGNVGHGHYIGQKIPSSGLEVLIFTANAAKTKELREGH